MTILLVVNILMIAFYLVVAMELIQVHETKQSALLLSLGALLVACQHLACVLIQWHHFDEQRMALLQAGLASMILTTPLLGLVILDFSRRFSGWKIWTGILILPVIALAVYFISPETCIGLIQDKGWYMVTICPVVNTWLFIGYFLFITSWYAVMSMQWYSRCNYRRQRIVALLTFTSSVTTIIAFTAYVVSSVLMLDILDNYYLEFGAFTYFLPITSLWIGAKRYRLHNHHQYMATNEATTSIGIAIMYLDEGGYVIGMNQKMQGTLGISGKGRPHVSSLLANFEEQKDLFSCLKRNGEPFLFQGICKSGGEENILMDCRVSCLHDRFDEPLMMVVGGIERKGLENIKADCGITGRELEIIEYILLGSSNTEIATSLGITLNTIKRHITNIYNKLGIENKIQLMNLAKRYR